jgi:hypothetical protein
MNLKKHMGQVNEKYPGNCPCLGQRHGFVLVLRDIRHLTEI